MNILQTETSRDIKRSALSGWGWIHCISSGACSGTIKGNLDVRDIGDCALGSLQVFLSTQE